MTTHDLLFRLLGPSPSLPAMQDAAKEIERLRQCLTDCLITFESNQDGLNGAQVALFIGRLRGELYR